MKYKSNFCATETPDDKLCVQAKLNESVEKRPEGGRKQMINTQGPSAQLPGRISQNFLN